MRSSLRSLCQVLGMQRCQHSLLLLLVSMDPLLLSLKEWSSQESRTGVGGTLEAPSIVARHNIK